MTPLDADRHLKSLFGRGDRTSSLSAICLGPSAPWVLVAVDPRKPIVRRRLSGVGDGLDGQACALHDAPAQGFAIQTEMIDRAGVIARPVNQ